MKAALPVAASTLPLTRGFLAWLQADPAWRKLPWGRRAHLHWQATLGSVNARLAQLNAGQGALPALTDPVLVLGPWRSGTTVMHELLAAASGLATPRTWQCMNATAFTTLSPQRLNRAVVARPMDGLAIGAQSPQEDEFALLSLGAASAYRGFFMPHRLAELAPTLSQSFWLKDTDWLPLWERFLRDVLRSTPGAHQPLLLKSPNHSFRLQAILRRFPQARGVWMLRDAATVFHSNLKMWRAMFARYGLSEPVPGGLESFIAQALQACADTLDDNAQSWRNGPWTLVPQARLRTDGAAVVHEVFERLRLPGPINEPALAAAIEAAASGREDSYTGSIVPAAQAAVRALDAAQARALEVQASD